MKNNIKLIAGLAVMLTMFVFTLNTVFAETNSFNKTLDKVNDGPYMAKATKLAIDSNNEITTPSKPKFPQDEKVDSENSNYFVKLLKLIYPEILYIDPAPHDNTLTSPKK